MFSFTNVNIFTMWIFLILLGGFTIFLIFKFFLLRKRHFLLSFSYKFSPFFKYFALFLSFLLLILAIFSPRGFINDASQSWTSPETVFLLDITKSMNATDIKLWIKNWSRLNAWKFLMSEYLNKSQDWLYGLVVFAWNARVISPMSADYEQIDTYIKGLSIYNDEWDWTNLIWALNTASNMFTKTAISRKVVLFTDWWHETQDFNALSRDYKTWNISLQIIGVGGDKKVKIPLWSDAFWKVVYKNYLGKTVLTSLNKDLIDLLSEKVSSSSKYFVWNITNKDKIIEEMKSKIDKLELSSKIKWKIDLSRHLAMLSFVFFILFLALKIYEVGPILKNKN